MRNLYPTNDPRFIASRVIVDAEEEEGIGRGHDFQAMMDSLTGDLNILYIHEDTDEDMILRAKWDPETAAWEVFEEESQLALLSQALDIIEKMEVTKLAAAMKACMFRLADLRTGTEEVVHLCDLDTITEGDPELT